MADNLTPEDRQKTMRAVRSANTGLERQLAAVLAGMRLSGWRKNSGDVVGKPDVVFRDEMLAIFVDGCFWHGCPECDRRLPVANSAYWEKKIRRNRERDGRNTTALRKSGWRVVRMWEHEMRDPEDRRAKRRQIRAALRKGGWGS